MYTHCNYYLILFDFIEVVMNLVSQHVCAVNLVLVSVRNYLLSINPVQLRIKVLAGVEFGADSLQKLIQNVLEKWSGIRLYC